MKRLLCLAFVLVATEASAQTSDEARASATALYRHASSLFRDGMAKKDRAMIALACLEYRKSLAAADSPKTTWNVAACEMQLQNYAAALPLLRDFERRGTSDWRAELKAFKAEAIANVGLVDIDAPAGARLFVDGVEQGKAPLADTVPVQPGSHVVVAELGSARVEAPVTVAAGTTSRVKLEEPPPPAPAPVVIGPAIVVPPPARAEEPSFWTTRRFVGVGVIGAGALALGGSALFASSAHSERDRAASYSPALAAASPANSACTAFPDRCADLEDAIDARARAQTWSTALLVGGAAAIVVGSVLVLLPQKTGSVQVALTPVPLPGGAALQLSGVMR